MPQRPVPSNLQRSKDTQTTHRTQRGAALLSHAASFPHGALMFAACFLIAACGDDGGPGESPDSTGGTGATASGGSSPSSGGGATQSTGGMGPGSGATGPSGGTGGTENTGGTPASGGGGAGTGGTAPGGADGAGGYATGGADGAGGTGGDGGTGGGPQELPKFVGNITTHTSVDTDGFIYSEYWDQITPENAGKWGSVQPTMGSARRWDTLDAIYDYTQEQGIIFKEHTFVWGTQQPSGSISESDVKDWMNAFCERYPNTPLIDVVNEPPPHTTPSYAEAIGGGTFGSWQWIINAFKWAREACPNAILILNDYNTIEWPEDNQRMIDIANTLQEVGAPIDALGAQSHGLSGGVSTERMIELLTKLHEDTGLPVYISEYDIDLNDDQAQLAKFQEHLPFFLETDWIPGITLWGWIHGKTWVPNSGLIRNGQARPAMVWLMEELGRPVP